MSQNIWNDKSALVQVMAWCRQETRHYPSQCRPSRHIPSSGHSELIADLRHLTDHYNNNIVASTKKNHREKKTLGVTVSTFVVRLMGADGCWWLGTVWWSWEWVPCYRCVSLQWRHNEQDGVSNHQRLDCLLNHLFRPRSKKTSKLRVTDLCEGNSLVTGEFPAERASNAKNISIWWRHHVLGMY